MCIRDRTTIAAIIYDSGSSGLCSISLGIQTPTLARNSLILLSSTSIVRVLSVTVGPDGLYSFRCNDPHTHVAGDAVRSIVTFRVYTTISIPSSGVGVPTSSTTITGNALETQVTAGVGYATKTVALDLSQFAFVNGANRPLQPDDYMHISLRFDVPSNISSGRILLDVDPVTNDFTQNFYYKEFRQSDLQSAASGTLTSVVAIQTAIQNQSIDTQAPDTGTTSLQLDTGTAQWTELFINYSDLVRVGTNQAVDLEMCIRDSIMSYLNGQASYAANVNGFDEALSDGTTVGPFGNTYVYYGQNTRNGVVGSSLNSTPYNIGSGSTPGTIEYDVLNSQYFNCYQGTGEWEPNTLMTTPKGYGIIQNRFQTQQRFQNVKLDAGFTGMQFNGSVVMASRYVPGSDIATAGTRANKVAVQVLTETLGQGPNAALQPYPTLQVPSSESILILNARKEKLNLYISSDGVYQGGFREFIPEANSTVLTGLCLMGVNLTVPTPYLHQWVYGFNA